MIRIAKKYLHAYRDRKIRRHSVDLLQSLSVFDLVEEVKEARLTYLGHEKLAQISKTIKDIGENDVDGIFVEAGCALGGSTIVIAKLKPDDKKLAVYDVFGMIPPPTADDTPDVKERYRVIAEGKSAGIGGDKYYGYVEDLYSVVQKNLRDFAIDTETNRVHLIKGLLQDTLQIDEPVAFAHIDVDWYEPVKVSLERIFPRLAVGGSIILDDYFDWGGCRKATDEFLAAVSGQFETDERFRNLKVTRTRSP